VFYLAAIVDLRADRRRWAMSAVNDRHSPSRRSATIKRRQPDIGLLHHSDRGARTPARTIGHSRKHGIVRHDGQATADNAAMESWFSTFKAELGETCESIRRGKDLAFDYIEVFYNQRRRHSSIGYLAPAEYERHYHETRNTSDLASLSTGGSV
jgi:transposase InsO family protein